MAKKRATKVVKGFQNRICNVVPSKNVADDWTFQDALTAGVFGAVAALPPKVDLRADWWKINDQGSTGSCVGWATADGVMRQQLVKAGKLGQNELLSARFVWMGSKETDEFTTRPQSFIEEAGTSLKAAMDIVRKYGTVLESLLPFKINTLMHIGTEKSFYAAASLRKAQSYINLGKNLNQWKSWLATKGPILAALGVDETWDNASATAGKLDVFQPNTVRGGHAICVVGYTADRFIIRNSWGTAWGDKGFGYASAAYIADGFFGESYGVTLS